MIKHLSLIGRVTTPAAMVVFMAYEISTSMKVSGWWSYFVLFGAILTAVGVEIVGILSGSTLEGFWRQGNLSRSILSFVLLMIYTGAAIYILRNNSTLWPIPIVATVVYIVSALSESLVNQEQKQEVVDKDSLSWKRKQEAIQAEREYEFKLEKERLATQVKMERAKAQPAQQKQSKSIMLVQPAMDSYECEDCNRVFGTVQALNAHGRFCKGVLISQNGSMK